MCGMYVYVSVMVCVCVSMMVCVCVVVYDDGLCSVVVCYMCIWWCVCVCSVLCSLKSSIQFLSLHFAEKGNEKREPRENRERHREVAVCTEEMKRERERER